ncbi:MAG: NADH-ubiquinone oxidoreductase chain G [Ktedonobacterales bacterium]|jgi:NADH-quinone oxidoreductase chain G|nr:MAG: NADH-ubiquinone oxidoreductase chain G [Ktedonobacterales bacterium]
MAEQEELVNLTIDGQPVSVPKGSLIWAAAQKLGIEIPIYCYHPKMDPLGACRMCFVEVEKMPKLATACTTTVAEGMVVSTTSAKVKKGRAGTLEFLLINHPLDCPICDKGGECDLQDFTLRYGPGGSRFDLNKRHFEKPIPVSENILLDRERCIACQRCVRFTQTVAMENGLVMEQRGFRIEVGVDPAAPFDSIFSGNVVEMCPVGALTAKNYRFVTRPWELKKTPSVCGNCSVGCNVRVDVRVDKVLRQYSRTNDAIDDGWLCDRGRWDLDWINDTERLRTPLIRRDGQLQPVSWDEALRFVAERLRAVRDQRGARAIGGIGSTHTTNEEAYLFQKLLRAGLGTNNVDHAHGRFPATEPGALPWAWSDSIAGLEQASHIVLLGADPYHRQPIVDLRIRKAIRAGARVYVVTPEANRLDRLVAGVIRYTAGHTGTLARALLNIITSDGLARGEQGAQRAADRRASVAQETPERAAQVAGVDADALRELAREIAGAKGAVILYDEAATLEPSGATLAADVLDLALITGNFGKPGAGAGPLLADNNSLGARDMGLLPDTLPGYRPVGDAAAHAALGGAWLATLPAEPGLSYTEMLSGGVKALYVMGANPARDATPEQLAALDALDFLVVQDLTLTETAQRATVVLPAVAYTEKDGSFTNTERCVQLVRRAMQPLGGAKADWEILVGVARALGLGWTYLSPAEILSEIGRTVPLYAGVTRRSLGAEGVRWPFAPGERTPEGRATITGSPSITWQMLAEGVARAQKPGGELIAPRGRGE